MEARAIALDEGTLLEELGWVYGLARRLVTDANDADDLVQEAWLKAHSTPAERFSSRPRLRAWLAAVTRRLARDPRRSRGRRAWREECAAQSEVHASAADVVERSALLEAVLHAVRELPEPYRSTVLLRFMDGFSTAEVAAEMSVSEELVRKRQSRAFARLRGVLAKEWDGALPDCDSITEPSMESTLTAQRERPFDSKALGAALLAGLGLVVVAQLLPPQYEVPAFRGFASTTPEPSPLTLTVPSSSSQGSGAVFLADGPSQAESEAPQIQVSSVEADPTSLPTESADLASVAVASAEAAGVDAARVEAALLAEAEPAVEASGEPSPALSPAVEPIPEPVVVASEQAIPDTLPLPVLDPVDPAALAEAALRAAQP